MLRQLDHEVMRRMTVLARHLAVKAVIGRRQLVAAAASSSERVSVFAPGVGVMTSEAPARCGELGVIRVHGFMTLRARSSRVVPHIVGRVATRAARVLRHLGRGEHHHILMARAALDRLLGFECVRPMTAHALRVPAGKQRRRRHDGLVLAVTVDARRHGIGGRRVLMRVTGRAHAVARLRERGMRGADVLVAIVAGRRDRLLILVRRVAM